jgi:hypothetical protein
VKIFMFPEFPILVFPVASFIDPESPLLSTGPDVIVTYPVFPWNDVPDDIKSFPLDPDDFDVPLIKNMAPVFPVEDVPDDKRYDPVDPEFKERPPKIDIDPEFP